jgi:cytochrome c peroxidase
VIRRAAAFLLLASAACSGPAANPDGPPTLSAADRAALAQLSPAQLPAPPADISNYWANDPAAARLGQKFFMDKGFSGRLLNGDNDGSPGTLGVKGETGKVSCAGCHVPSAGFLDNRVLNHETSISLAAGWNLRRTPPLLDVGQARLLMWDGRHDALYNQPFGPVENPNEMNSSRLFLAEQIVARYRADYEAVFGPLPDSSGWPVIDSGSTGCDQPVTGTPTCHGKPGDQAEYDSLSAGDKQAITRVVANFGKALGAYERLLTCGQGRFDAWVHGNATALTNSEQRGAQLFVGKARCATCHSGPFLSDQKFHNVGLRAARVATAFIDVDDHGASLGLAASLADPLNVRGAFSDGDDGRLFDPTPAMEGAFRTPVLRCAAQRPSFMHTGQMHTLAEVVDFFDQGGHVGGYPGTNEISPLGLTDQEKTDLAAFLGALDGPGPSAALLGP